MWKGLRWLVSKTVDGVPTPADHDAQKSSRTDATADTYNYRRFRFCPASEGIQRGVNAGEEATDTTVYTLDGDSVQLSSLWNDQPVVFEFGSITCPIFAGKVDAMNELAAAYGDDVDFYVVYTREAHPGQQYHRHTSFEQKRRHALDAQRDESIERDVLIDDVEGTMHRAYDSLPNSVYVIGRDGVVAHRADWLDTEVLRERLDELLARSGRGADVSPTSLEENYHKPDADLFSTALRVHRRAGAGSLRDMLMAGPRMLAYRIVKRVRDRAGL